MKVYQCHKQVLAAPIVSLYQNTGGTHIVELEGGEQRVVPSSVFARGTPQPKDYLVQYDDEYFSWSPKKVFEDGYTLIPGKAGTDDTEH